MKRGSRDSPQNIPSAETQRAKSAGTGKGNKKVFAQASTSYKVVYPGEGHRPVRCITACPNNAPIVILTQTFDVPQSHSYCMAYRAA